MKVLGALVLIMGLANAAAAESNIVVSCNVRYTLADGQTMDLNFNSKAVQNQEYVTVDEILPLANGAEARFYVYYDGEYSAINVFHRDSGTYLNADSEVAVGKRFNLTANMPNDVLFKQMLVGCISK